MNQKQYIQIGCTSAVVAILFFFVAFIVPPHITSAVHNGIQSTLIHLTPHARDTNASHWLAWSNSSATAGTPQYVTVHFWDVSNPNDVVERNAPPELAELQPLRLRINRLRFNTEFDVDNSTGQDILSYHEQVYYTVDPTFVTDTTLDTAVTTVNFILLGINTLWPSSLADLYPDDTYTDASRLFVQRSVGEMLFGYVDSVSGQIYPGLLHNCTTQAEALSQPPHTIYTHTRQQHSWAGEQYVTVLKSVIDKHHRAPVWSSVEANRVHGSDGEVFVPTDVYPGSTLITFVHDLYRTTLVQNNNSSTVYMYGVELLKYVAHPNLYANVATVPSNAVYHNNLYSGVLNLTTAYQQLPVFVSKPLFMDADAELQNHSVFNSMQQYERADLESELCVEPNSAVTMRAHKRYQINVNVKPIEVSNAVTWFDKFDADVGVYLPVVWFDQHGEISKSNAQMFKQKVLNNLSLAHTGANVLLLMANALICVSVAAFLQAVRTKQYDTEIDSLHTDYQERLLP